MVEMEKNSGGGRSPLERIKSYIEKTGLSDMVKDNYALRLAEVRALFNEARSNPYNAIVTAFNYGVVKGYRAARAEARR